MGNLRELVEADLSFTLEGEWGLPIHITYPDGTKQSLVGQVIYNTQDIEGMWTNKPCVTIRLSSLDQEIDESKALHVRIPKTPEESGTLVDYICERPLMHGKSIGVITLYLTKAEQV